MCLEEVLQSYDVFAKNSEMQLCAVNILSDRWLLPLYVSFNALTVSRNATENSSRLVLMSIAAFSLFSHVLTLTSL